MPAAATILKAAAIVADPSPVGAGSEDEDVRALVERARTEPEAVAALYRRYAARVYAFAYRRSGSAGVAEEITSATFERVVAGLGGFQWRGGGFEPWLFRIATTETAAWFRRARRAEDARARLARATLPTAEDGGGDAGAGAAVAGVMAALSRLRPRYQHAISLRYLSGLSHEEAAAAMACTKPVFAVILHRAIAALRRELGAPSRRRDARPAVAAAASPGGSVTSGRTR